MSDERIMPWPEHTDVTAVVSRSATAALQTALTLRRLGYPTEWIAAGQSNKSYRKAVARGMKHEMCVLLDEDVAIDTVLQERYDLTTMRLVDLIIREMASLPSARYVVVR